MERKYKVIAIDFDGTLFETEYPTILRPIFPVLSLAKERKAQGDKLILWTCREGAELDAAIEMCRNYGLEFDAVNDNLPEMKEQWGNNPRKVSADEYWDDTNDAWVEYVLLYHDVYDNCALKNMPVWSALYVLKHGGALDAEVIFGFIQDRLWILSSRDLEWLRDAIARHVNIEMDWDTASDEHKIVAHDALNLAQKIARELEGRKVCDRKSLSS